MFFRGIHKQGEVNYDIEKILELAGKLKDAWEGDVLTESGKEKAAEMNTKLSTVIRLAIAEFLNR